MMNRHSFLHAGIAAAALFALAGCAHDRGASMSGGSTSGGSTYSGSMSQSASQDVYTATMTAGEEVPPAANSKGTGTAEVRVDTKTNEVTWKVSYSGLTGPATMGHIHGPAAAGSNAGVVVPFPNVAGATSAEGKGKLTQAQYGDLAAGLYYVNIHTAQYPGGEIRGQLKKKQ